LQFGTQSDFQERFAERNLDSVVPSSDPTRPYNGPERPISLRREMRLRPELQPPK